MTVKRRPTSRPLVILADPPWKYGNRCAHSKTKFGGGVHAHYPVLATPDICAIPIARDYPTTPAALFLWVTGPHLQGGLDVLAAWGFRFATIVFAWVKVWPIKSHVLTRGRLIGRRMAKPPRIFGGTGFYTRSNVELVLLGVRGSMPPADRSVKQVMLLPHPRHPADHPKSGKIIHSRKPPDFHAAIERLYPDARRVELFARITRPGWDAWGNQLPDAPRELVADMPAAPIEVSQLALWGGAA